MITVHKGRNRFRRAYLAGYGGHAPEQLHAAAKALGASVIDIRFSPVSANPKWRKYNLLQIFGCGLNYVWLRSLGNRNYAPENRHLGIAIDNLEIGIAALESFAKVGRCVILICACKRADGCHRYTVGKDLIALGWEVYDLDWDDPANSPKKETIR